MLCFALCSEKEHKKAIATSSFIEETYFKSLNNEL